MPSWALTSKREAHVGIGELKAINDLEKHEIGVGELLAVHKGRVVHRDTSLRVSEELGYT